MLTRRSPSQRMYGSPPRWRWAPDGSRASGVTFDHRARLGSCRPGRQSARRSSSLSRPSRRRWSAGSTTATSSPSIHRRTCAYPHRSSGRRAHSPLTNLHDQSRDSRLEVQPPTLSRRPPDPRRERQGVNHWAQSKRRGEGRILRVVSHRATWCVLVLLRLCGHAHGEIEVRQGDRAVGAHEDVVSLMSVWISCLVSWR